MAWGDLAAGFLTLFGTKIVLPGVGDPETLHAISTMVGNWDRPVATTSHGHTET